MQTLRDATALAVLLLLALTVRIDLGDRPLALDLETPAHAATPPARALELPTTIERAPTTTPAIDTQAPPCRRMTETSQARFARSTSSVHTFVLRLGHEAIEIELDPSKLETLAVPLGNPCASSIDPELTC